MKKVLASLLIISTVLTACNKVEIEDFTGDYQYTYNEGRIFNVTVGPLRENTKGEFEIIKQHKTSFYNEIIETGKLLYEKAS